MVQGLKLQMSENKLNPHLLGKLAAYASGKADSLKAIISVLPELCQVQPDSHTIATAFPMSSFICKAYALHISYAYILRRA